MPPITTGITYHPAIIFFVISLFSTVPVVTDPDVFIQFDICPRFLYLFALFSLFFFILEIQRERSRERSRERDRERQRETDRERQTETERDRQRERQRETDRDRERQTERDRERQTERDRETDQPELITQRFKMKK